MNSPTCIAKPNLMNSPGAAGEVHGIILAVEVHQGRLGACGDLGIAEVDVGRCERVSLPAAVEIKVLID